MIEFEILSIIYIALLVLCTLACYLIFQGILIATQLRRLLNRLDVATDMSGWFSFIRKFRKQSKD